MTDTVNMIKIPRLGWLGRPGEPSVILLDGCVVKLTSKYLCSKP